MLPNLPLSAEKPLSERFLWKYPDKKSTGEAAIRVKISAQAPIRVMFFLGIKNSETDLSNILMTFRVLKYLSKRIDLMAAPILLSIATALVESVTLQGSFASTPIKLIEPDMQQIRPLAKKPHITQTIELPEA